MEDLSKKYPSGSTSIFNGNKIFKIEVGNIPDDEIEDYVRNVLKRYRDATTNLNYMYVEPNSQFFGDLEQIINYIKLSPQINKEDLLMTLLNTKKRGFKLEFRYTWNDVRELAKKYNCRIEKITMPISQFDLDERSFDVKSTSTKLITCHAQFYPVDIINPLEQFFSAKRNSIIGIRLSNLNDENSLLWEQYNEKNKKTETFISAIVIPKLTYMERKEIYARIDGERKYQDEKWGIRRTLDGTPDEQKPVAEWINYMEYHLQKAKERVYHLDTNGALHEIRKVTALGVRTMEIHGCPERIVVSGTDESQCTCNDCDCKKE